MKLIAPERIAEIEAADCEDRTADEEAVFNGIARTAIPELLVEREDREKEIGILQRAVDRRNKAIDEYWKPYVERVKAEFRTRAESAEAKLEAVRELAECLWLNREETTGSGGLGCYGVPFDDLDKLYEAVDKASE